MSYKRFRRSSTNKMIGGVCGGLGDYFDIDPLVFRLLFVFLSFFMGGGLILYLLAWIITPGENKTIGSNQSSDASFNFAERDAEIIDDNKDTINSNKNGSIIAGIFLIGTGIFFFLDNYIDIDFDKIWPLAVIIVGFVLLTNAFNRKK